MGNHKKYFLNQRRFGLLSTDLVPSKIRYLNEDQEESLVNDRKVRQILKSNSFLSKYLDEKRIALLIQHLKVKTTKPGEILFREGEINCYLIIVVKGVFKFTQNEEVVKIDQPKVFGEVNLLHNEIKKTTLEAHSSGVCWVLNCDVFRRLLIEDLRRQQDSIISCLKNCPIFKGFSEEELNTLSDLVKTVTISRTLEIAKDKFFYIILSGSVIVKTPSGKETKLGKEDYFGFLYNNIFNVRYFADQSGVKCLKLSKDDFVKSFGLRKSAKNSLDYNKLLLKDFNAMRTVGVGGFGRVDLIQHKADKNLVFALKIIAKCSITDKPERAQILKEKSIQMSCCSPFIVKLYNTYRDTKCLYFLLEFCIGGDLWSLQRKQKDLCFSESHARFYAGCVLEGLYYLHKQNIIYRDLKPENVVLHQNGYAKLTDFGFSKHLNPNEYSYTLVGTPEYLSPELILRKPHNSSTDFWTFGVFIFELLAGRSPFKSSDSLSVYKRILEGIDNVKFPLNVSISAESIIRKLCKKKASERIGCQRNGVRDIFKHKWFSGIDWNKMKDQLIKPPFVPAVSSSVDCKYFGKCEKSKVEVKEDFSNWDESF